MTTQLLDLEQLRLLLKDRRLYSVAKITGLTYPTLKDLFDGKNNNPSYQTIYKLSEYFSENK
jgi:hypothetical protein